MDESISLDGVKQFYQRAGVPKVLQINKGADHRLSDPLHKRETTELVIRWFRGISTKTHNH